MKKIITAILLSTAAVPVAFSQTYYNVGHVSGSQVIGNRNVSVQQIGNPNGTVPACAMPFCYLIGAHTINPTSYKFSFSVPVNRLKLNLYGMHSGEVLSFYINGAHYAFNSSQISPFIYSGPFNPNCTTMQTPTINLDGDIGDGIWVNHANGIINILFPAIDSVRIMHNNHDACSIEFNFAADTGVFIRQPYTDTLFCAGDSLYFNYGVYNKFNTNNNFTVQLSNATGSFASPVNIGSKASDTAGIIGCKIPAGTLGGNGYRLRVVSSSPVKTSDTSIPIRIKPLPAAFNASTNSPICETDTLKLMGASSSSGVTWQWSGPGGFSSNAKDTIRAAAVFADSGKYILTATLAGCVIKDTETVVVKPLPAKPNATNNSPLCEGATLNLSSLSSTMGVSYEWNGPGSYTSNLANTSRTNVTAAMSGDYISTVTLNGCTAKDTTAVTIYPTPAAPVAGSNTPVCAGGDIKLTASAVPGASYEWTGPGSYFANSQNPTRTGVAMTDGGTYSVLARVNGCPSAYGSTMVNVTAGPAVGLYPNPGDSICPGWDVTFVALPSGGGPGPTYEWFKNGVSTGGTNVTYKASGVNDGDSFYVRMTAGTVCNTPVSSKPIRMTVLPVHPPPTVALNSNPGPWVWPGLEVVFKVFTTNAGPHPGYQWQNNGKDIPNATDSIYKSSELKTGDIICCIVTSNFLCANPRVVQSACVIMRVDEGAERVSVGAGVKIYPNPVTDKLIIEKAEKGTILQIFDIIGREIYSGIINSSKQEIDMSYLSKGNYVLQLTGHPGSYREVRKVVVE